MKLEVEIIDDGSVEDGIIRVMTKYGLCNIGSLYNHINTDMIKKTIVPFPKTKTKYIKEHKVGDTDLKVLYKQMGLCYGGLNFAMSTEETESHTLMITFEQPHVSLYNAIDIHKHNTCVERAHGKTVTTFGGFKRNFAWAYATSLNTLRPGFKQNFVSALAVKDLNTRLDNPAVTLQFFIGRKDKYGTTNIRECTLFDLSAMDKNNKFLLNKNWAYSATYNALELIKKYYPDEKTNWKKRGMK